MKQITTLGIDLAKHVFQIAEFDQHQRMVSNQTVSRSKLLKQLANLPPARIGIEACGSAHYFHQRFTQMGHSVHMLPASFVKGFVYGNKHDRNDAKAIGLAVMHPEAPRVQVKSEQQLHHQALLRVRQRRVDQRTACANQIRSILYEQGILMSVGHRHLRRFDTGSLNQALAQLIDDLISEFKQLDQQVAESDKVIKRLVQSNPIGQRLLELPGFGVLNVLASLVVNPNDFRNGRHYSAYLGLVPKQVGSGGKTTLQGVSKRGNTYHRQLLCHGARAFITCSKQTDHPLWQWADRLRKRKNLNIAVLALANRLARISWHIMRGEPFDQSKLAA